MEPSKHNILSKIHHSDDFFILNLLHGNADILTREEAESLTDHHNNVHPDFISKGYVVDPDEEDKLYRRRYLDFIDNRETDEIQLFYAPTYSCNFNCSYCYQEGYEARLSDNGKAVANAFFEFISLNFTGRRKYVTLFGGEPLLSGKVHHDFLEYFIHQCKEQKLDLAVVTNGYNLSDYLPMMSSASIREIQVTLDGPEKIHNSRRHLKDGTGTFSRIVAGIDGALKLGLPVNLRVVLDRDNIHSLVELAEFAKMMQWTQSPYFKTQLGRNYELHYCQSQQSRLYSRIELYRDLYSLILKHPVIMEFHKPSFSVSKFLFENGELPDPLYDSCPGCKTEWAFDFTGKIYSCTATVGKPGEDIGSFFPEKRLDNVKVMQWQNRDVLDIEACKTCNLRLACGGGCASVAFNRDHVLNAPDCRPVKELLELGMALYRERD